MNAIVAAPPPPPGSALLQQVQRAGLVRQLWAGILLTLAIAGGLWAFFWLQRPALITVQSGIDAASAAEFANVLRTARIPVTIDSVTGDVRVPGERLQDARMALATAGLGSSDGPGMALIERDPGFGVSQFVEAARYQRALETELARTIRQLRPIREARVHLALPRPTAFTRQQQPAAASVVVGLLPGRFLKPDEVQAIQHLVASGIPNMVPERVTVVDESGRLLTRDAAGSPAALRAEQFALTREKETALAMRITSLIEPLVGVGRVRSEVALDLDFAQVEEAREVYAPESGQLRSEQVSEERRTAAGEQGVPGAASNTPPGPADPAAVATTTPAGESASSRTRNFELDRTLTHTRQPTGRVRRVTAAVVVDNMPNIAATAPVAGEAAAPAFRPLSAEELQRIESLVRQVVGFNETRGDEVTVVNAAFVPLEPLEPLSTPLWENPLVWQVARILVGALLVLLVVFLVLRPALRQLLATPEPEDAGTPGAAAYADTPALPPGAAGTALALPGQAGQAGSGLPLPTSVEGRIEYARQAVKDDPRRVAQVMKEWIANDA